jgi:hypothetical protein
MDHPRFDEYQSKFEELSFLADQVDKPDPPLDECSAYLCQYGENGLTTDEEFAFLDKLEKAVGENLRKVVVATPYWEDTILFIP